jgi:hypothetical protein
MMPFEERRDGSELLATPRDYRNYFGVPRKTISPSEFLRWAESIAAAVTTELDQTRLPAGEQDMLRQGLALALKVLSGERAGAVTT